MVFRLPSQRSQIGVVIGVGNGGHHGAVGAEKIGCAAAFRLDHFFPLAILFLIALGHCPLCLGRFAAMGLRMASLYSLCRYMRENLLRSAG